MEFKEILKKYSNKYLIVTLIFAVVIIFTDKYNIFNQIKNYRELKEARKQLEFYENEIAKEQKFLDSLHKDSIMLERIAREKYMMKRDNEVIYIIEAKED